MKERPIIFTADSVRGILAGAKTQTRRVIKPQFEPWVETTVYPSGDYQMGNFASGTGRLSLCVATEYRACPYGIPGDHLWVRETYSLQTSCDCSPHPFSDGRPLRQWVDSDSGNRWAQPYYRATDPEPELCCESPRCRCCREGEPGPHWKSAMFMPQWASRIGLELTDVRVQRVQEINREDARAEGIDADGGDDEHRNRSTVENYRVVWDQINAKRESGAFAWAKNPWVWALSFKAARA